MSLETPLAPFAPETPAIPDVPLRPRLRARLAPEHLLSQLMDEHQRLLVVLDRLDAIAREELGTLREKRRLALLGEVHAIALGLLAAERHHRLEEEVLYPALRQRGWDGPTDVVVAEHAAQRKLATRLAELSLRALQASGPGWTETMRVARELAAFFRAHMRKEDEVLYPLAYQHLAEPDWIVLEQRCAALGGLVVAC